MPLLIEVTLRKKSDKLECDAGELDLTVGDNVIIESEHGLEAGVVSSKERFINDKDLRQPPAKIIRKFTPEDYERLKENRRREREIIKTIAVKIEDSEIDMRLSAIEYNFDRSKLFIYYTAENRVDFREFIKSLGHMLKVRVQMVQIGVRDETKMLGGIGICGRPFCCATHLKSFETISIDMAKNQDLTLNMQKLSGHCGRLMCCLSYEEKFYLEEKKKYPRVGATVKTPEGEGGVISCNYISGEISVKLGEGVVKTYKLSEVKW